MNGIVPPESVFLPEGRTDTNNARRFALDYASAVRWCDQWETWLVWDGQHWAPDVTLATRALAKTIWKSILTEIGVKTDG